MTSTTATFPHAFPAFAPRPLTGALEAALAQTLADGGSRPLRVSLLLALTLAEVAGEAVDLALVRRFSAATREWLVQQVAALFQPAVTWLQGRCSHCGENFDAAVQLACMPCKPPGASFPLAFAETAAGRLVFDVPNGAHEEAAAGTGAAARLRLACLCCRAAGAAAFREDELPVVDAALEAASPEVADCAETACPSCGAPTRARLDPLRFAFPNENRLLLEVHRLAAAYGWSETAILALPSSRRLAYLALIEPGQRRSGGRP